MKMRKSAAFILSVLFFFTAAPAQPAEHKLDNDRCRRLLL